MGYIYIFKSIVKKDKNVKLSNTFTLNSQSDQKFYSEIGKMYGLEAKNVEILEKIDDKSININKTRPITIKKVDTVDSKKEKKKGGKKK